MPNPKILTMISEYRFDDQYIEFTNPANPDEYFGMIISGVVKPDGDGNPGINPLITVDAVWDDVAWLEGRDSGIMTRNAWACMIGYAALTADYSKMMDILADLWEPYTDDFYEEVDQNA